MGANSRWWWIVIALGISIGMGVVQVADAAEQKEFAVSAGHLLFGQLPQPAAVALLSRDGEDDFEVDGDDAALDRIDGRNHDLSGDLVGSGDQPGIATDVGAADIEVEDVTVAGSVPVLGGIDPFDLPAYLDFLLARADVTITSNTTYDGGSIGSPTDYQIVVLENAKLFLQGNFTGYGILVLYDTNPGNGLAELRMEDQATWYGVILSYTGDSPGNSDKIRMRFGNQGGGPGGGPEAGEGVRVMGMVIAMGREVEIEFPNDGVADLFYSSAAVANADADIQSKPYRWERWRETE